MLHIYPSIHPSTLFQLLDDLHGHLEHLMKGLLKMGGVVKHETLSFVAGAIMSNKGGWKRMEKDYFMEEYE